MIYLDYNATAPMKPAVGAGMLEAIERCGNPSSVHRFGRVVRRHIEEARASVAALAGVKPAAPAKPKVKGFFSSVFGKGTKEKPAAPPQALLHGPAAYPRSPQPY